MTDLLEMSARFIDRGEADEPVNRINHELSGIDSDIAMVEAFSHSIVFRTDAGLVVFDTSGAWGGQEVVDAIRGWSAEPFHTIVYTHGHVDHVGGSGAFVADARERTGQTPRILAHENVPKRFGRYELTDGYNLVINQRQFGGFKRRGYHIGGEQRFLPEDVARPEATYRDSMSVDIGGLGIELRHARGETDDHTWAWVPERRAICAGDFFIWNFPNAGNPQKVQRYPLEWAAALREMAAMEAELFMPAHGLPIAGRERIRGVLTEVADVLENLVHQVLELMNAGARLNDILHTVEVDPDALAKPYLAPLYDEPEFVARNVWRLYGGWYDGNPAHLKPARDDRLAAEVAGLAGGARPLAERARELADAGELRLACHLVEMAAAAADDDAGVHALRAEIYQLRRDRETSLMAKGIFGTVANESRDRAGTGSDD